MSKPTGQRWTIKTERQLSAFNDWVAAQWREGHYPTMQMLQADRSTSQNSYFYALYRDISAALGDQSLIEIKCVCKLHYGVAIKKANDPEWAEFYDKAIKPMTYEHKLMLMNAYPITSDFNKAQGTAYIDTIISEYQKQGYPLTDPRNITDG